MRPWRATTASTTVTSAAFLGHVDDHGLGAAAVVLDHGGGFPGGGAVPVEGHHVRAGTGEEHGK